jgi:DNA-binding transcriptional ArsR family regulator
MLEHLFGSKTRLKLLKAFFREPDRSYYVRELTRLLDAQINAIRRELELLIAAGIVVELDSDFPKQVVDSSEAGSSLRKYYRLNKESILYSELQALLLKAQVIGEEQFFHDIQEKGGELKLLLLSGRFSGDKRSPTDLLIVGKIHERPLERLIASYEKEYGTEIRYTVMTEQEFYDRRHIMDKFIFSVFEAKHIIIVNDLKA